MQSRPESKQRVANAVALVIATALSGVTLWGVLQMAPTDTEILGAANVPWVHPRRTEAPRGGAQAPEPPAPHRVVALRP